MKMKKACEATSLTERAIRLYIAKGLITPGQKDGLIDFSPEDIQHLRDISCLRQIIATHIPSPVDASAAVRAVARVVSARLSAR